MTDKKMREEFEAFANSNHWNLALETLGIYMEYSTQCAWLAWQESRAALAVVAPKVFPDDSTSRVCAKYSEAIEAAGVKVKS